MADILELLRSLRPEAYDNNLPASAGTRGPLLPSDADVAAARERLGMGTGALEDADTGDEHYGDLPDSNERPYLGQGRAGQLRRTLEQRRAQMRGELADRQNNPDALDARVARAYQSRFAGTTPGSPDFLARVTGEVRPANPGVRYEDTELRRLQNRPALPQNVAGYEDTEFRRGVPPAPPGALPLPQENPRGVGSVPGDKRLLSDEERLKVLQSQLNDPNRNMSADAELRREIAMLEKKVAGTQRVATAEAVPQGPSGALADADDDAGAEPDADADDTATGALPAPATGQEAAAPAKPPPAARKSLDQAFHERVAAAEEKIGRDLTDKEKNQLKLDFFLRLMQAGGQRGNNLATNVGMAGLGTEGEYNKAMERRRQLLKDARDEAYRETTLADKDRDNQLAERREEREGRQGDQRLSLLRDQISQGKFDVKVGGRGGNFLLIDKKTGKVTDTGIKAADAVNSTRPAALQILDHLKEHPEDGDQLLRIMKVDQGEKEESKLLDLSGKLMSSDLTGKMTPQEAVRRARSMLEEIRNPGAGAGGLPSFNTPAELEQAKRAGKVKPGDRVMTPQGERIVR